LEKSPQSKVKERKCQEDVNDERCFVMAGTLVGPILAVDDQNDQEEDAERT
jgi:hypothetical protein